MLNFSTKGQPVQPQSYHPKLEKVIFFQLQKLLKQLHGTRTTQNKRNRGPKKQFQNQVKEDELHPKQPDHRNQ